MLILPSIDCLESSFSFGANICSCSRSAVSTENLEAHFLESNFLRLGTGVRDHSSADAILDSLGDIVYFHEIF